MKTAAFNWTLSHSKTLYGAKEDVIPATVPGAVGLDYAKAKNYPPYYFGNNFELFRWMEDEYFTYEAKLCFYLDDGEYAFLNFEGIDYEYTVRLDGEELCHGEGMTAPTKLEVTDYAGVEHVLEVVIFPVPKYEKARRKNTRDEAAYSCKPASAYGWDWHPRLIPTGIWKDATLEIHKAAPVALDASYRLSDDLKSARVEVELDTVGEGECVVSLIDPCGEKAYEESFAFSEFEYLSFGFDLDTPKLWYPRGYGEQPIYTLRVESETKTLEKRIGFRRAKLVRNAEDTWWEREFPKPRLPAPATFEINGVRVFAKGSNWVNGEIFPALMTKERYDELIGAAYDANINIFRMWGGQYINHDYFYDKCDELGIMLWQEFMLSCNLHPDDDKYLATLESEATFIIKNLRTHPSIVLWCGGNELFNSWSGMTDQSHPLRMLNSLCYELDRNTPFNYTSPMTGMAHGTYVTLFKKHKAKEDSAGLGGEIDCDIDAEFISVLKDCRYTAYTEFGSSGGADPDYVKKYIMTEEDYNNRSPKNPVWVNHHGYGAWGTDCWLCEDNMDYYFGGFDGTDDLMKKTLFVQSISYKSLFEEMRKQWPRCSMAINWDFNEPWPCVAGNSLLNWPSEPKPALKAVGEALRPTIASIRTGKNRFLTGEVVNAEVWVLNDSPDAQDEMKVNAYIEKDGEKKLIATSKVPACPPRENRMGESFTFAVTEELDTVFTLLLEVEGREEMNSHYEFIRK